MILNIKKRLIILSMLPKSSSISEQTIARDIAKKIELNPETVSLVELLRDEAGNLKWNPEKEELLEVDFSGAEVLLLREIVEGLDKDKKVNPENLDVCLDIKAL